METPPKKKSKLYHQTFNSVWLNDPEFKDWLIQDEENKNACYCKCCSFSMKNANRSSLMKHKNSVKHKDNFRSASTSVNIAQFFKKQESTECEQIAKSELLISSFFSEHNIPFSNADHFSTLRKRIFPDSQIAKKIAMKKTKLSYVIQDGIAFHESQSLTDVCKQQKFSIIIDESTDISVSQILAVVVRYFDFEKEDVVDALFDAITVENGTAVSLFNAVTELFAKKRISLNNIIGFGSDNCSTMMGVKNGFQKLLKDKIPSVFVMGCVCHSFALCSSYAVGVLPNFLEEFLMNISSYFSRSSKRQRDLSLIQEVTNSSLHKIPKLAQTRWLSREKVITAILEQYGALILYFQTERQNSADIACKIHDTLVNCGTKHMFLFLQYILQKVNGLNIEFQSEQFRLHRLYQSVATEYKNILSFFIKEEALNTTKLSAINPNDKGIYKKLEDIYLGARSISQLLKELFLTNELESRFRNDCLKVLVELCCHIKKRFPMDTDSVISKLKVMDPKIASDINQSPITIAPLASHFPNLISEQQLNILDDEWRCFRLCAKDLAIEISNVPKYWFSLRNIKDGLDNPKFPLLSSFMCQLTALPHSSACVERIFSQVNCVKTKKTNALKVETVKNRLLAKQSVSKNSQNCTTWEPTKLLIGELEDGTVHRRYEKRIKEERDRSGTVYLSVDDEDE